MIDDEVKLVALVLIGAMAVVAVSPVITTGWIVEPFSELGVLGPNGKVGDYPKEINVGEQVNLFIYVGNQEGRSKYYQVFAKLSNESNTTIDAKPLDVPPFAIWNIVLMNGQNTTLPITLSFNDSGLNKRLVFELYVFNPASNGFEYDNKWIQLWLNVT
jgi:uncharacterized membrane protein